jgi:DNA-binding PadR family transcriptional regulator
MPPHAFDIFVSHRYIESIYTIAFDKGGTTLYELFVLGELMDRPMHGYMLSEILTHSLGPLRSVSYGTLYPMMRRMELDGLIAPYTSDVEDDSLRKKKQYTITAKGRADFLHRMLQPLPTSSEALALFHFKLVNLHHLKETDIRTIWLDYQRHLLERIREYGDNIERIQQHEHLSTIEQQDILRAIDHTLHLLQSDLVWVNLQLKNIPG